VTNRVALAAIAATMLATPAAAQFASDFPGVPRAAISVNGGKQDRLAWALTGYKVPNGAATGDTIAGGLRLSYGRSYRVQSQFEVGFDITLLDGLAVQPPSTGGATTGTTSASRSDTYMRGLTGYGLRIGAKYRPVVNLDPDGNGYELAVGAAFQPELKALYGVEKKGDSTRIGGQFNKDAITPSATFNQNPFASINPSTTVAAMGSYRSKRLQGDVAIVSETVPDRELSADPSPIGIFNGISARAGGAFRLTPGFAVGASYWGSGSPPWWDQVALGTPGKAKNEQFGFLLQLGSNPESGIDLMVTSPTGNFGESARLYIRSRSTH
jgi:hypothetical protein